MIPKIIHQIWFWDKERPEVAMNTRKEMNPYYEYKLWTEENIWDLINQKQFDECNQWCWKADIARYEILLKEWWIYIDADSICLRPLTDDLLDNDFFSCYENEQCRWGLIANWYIWSKPWNGILKLIIETIWQYIDINSQLPWIKTWPKMFTEHIKIWSIFWAKFKIYPSYYFIPQHYSWIKYEWDFKPYSNQLWWTTLNLYK